MPEIITAEIATTPLAAVEGSPGVVDMPLAGFDPSPGALDLPEEGHRETCSRCARPAIDRCKECGSLLCEDCVAADEG